MKQPLLDKRLVVLSLQPQAYNYTIRLKSISKYLSWLFINLLPTSFYALAPYISEGKTLPLQVMATFIVFFFGIHYMYEFGYIYNDNIAIEKESNPSIRLTEHQLHFFKKNIGAIFAIRVAVFALCMAGTYALLPCHNTLTAIAIAIINTLLFYLYNIWRSRYNVWLYLPLVASRFLPYAWLVPKDFTTITALLLLLIYPLEIGIERFSIEKYRFAIIRNIIPSEESKAGIRALYYLIITPLTNVILIANHISPIYLLPFLLFMIYRITHYIVRRKSSIKQIDKKNIAHKKKKQ